MAYENGNARLIRGIPVSNTLPTNGQSPTYSSATGEYVPGSTISVAVPIGISDGGTGEVTAQAAIDSISQVAAATNEYVLTKDTATGNALWKAGGSFAWNTTVTGTTGEGVTLTMDNNYSTSVANALSIVMNNTQTLASELRGINISTGTFTDFGPIGIRIESQNGNGIAINTFGAEMLTSGKSGILVGSTGTNNTSTYTYSNISVINADNNSTGVNTGLNITNYSTKYSTGTGAGILANQQGTDGTAFAITTKSNVNASTNGLFNITLSDTQSAASYLSKLDLGTSARGNRGLYILPRGASATQYGVYVDFSGTGTGRGALFTDGNYLDVGILYAANNETSGKYLTVSSLFSGSLSSRSAEYADVTISRENTAGAGTVSDSYSLLKLSRTNIQNGAGGTLAASGSVLDLINADTQAAGTLTSTVNVLKLTQSSVSTGAAIYASTAGTGKILIKMDSGFTTSTAPTGASTYIIMDIGGTEYKLLAQATS